VDVGESPAAAAVREAREEISADVQLVRLVDVLGGPHFEVSYPNGDRTAYVTAIYEARIITGSPAPGDGGELAWFTPGQLRGLQLSRFSRPPYATGRLGFITHPRRAAPGGSMISTERAECGRTGRSHQWQQRCNRADRRSAACAA
jgi:8-oxo-dGTP pyrophosphatase MutT (NUDIX family)